RVFAGTWNVGGRSPNNGLNLEDFLQVEGSADIYVLGFQEIVPLNAGNVLVIEDNEPAAKWLALISHALNKPSDRQDDSSETWNGAKSHVVSTEARPDAHYSLVASKQMVGIFLSVWVRSELVPHVGHLRVATVGRGIMGCLGNKGCIAMSMSLHRTSFCFVCSHLTSGEKEGDELKRNADVSEILKSTQFPKVCKIPGSRIPEKILEHDRILWLGDLNYRIALSYNEARTLLEDNDWDSLLGRDQLKMEREAGRVFDGWKEGKIYFAPTYKYSYNSDAYAGETTKSKKKRRTPAWCDRILWYGEGIEQLQYFREESRFSDHRPVCAVFLAQVEASSHGRCRKGYSSVCSRFPRDEIIPQRHSFYEY
ncbi:endonuclease exonuclease phosphatase family domain containing protein, partial [Musa troglodytarum]